MRAGLHKASTNTAQRIRRRQILLLAFAVLWGVVWFVGAQSRSLLEPDEGRYAEVPREMVASGNWITPRVDGVKFFDKPPLQYWATALTYETIGSSNFSARLWPLLLGLAGMLVVGWAGLRVAGRRTGLSAALVLGSSFLWAMGSHINTLDLGVSAILAMVLATFIVAQLPTTAPSRRRNLMWLTWALIAAAVLSKGLIGIVFPAGALFFYLLVKHDWARLRQVELLWGGLLALLILLPWFIAVSVANPEFFHYFFIREHFTRFLTNQDARVHPFWFFVPVVIVGMFPWLSFLPAALRRPWRVRPTQDRQFDPRLFLWIWTWMIFLFFSISHSKLPFYILPIFPALALLMGMEIERMQARAVAIRLGISVILLAIAVPALYWIREPQKVQVLGSAFHDFISSIAVALAVLVLILAVAVVLAWRRRVVGALLLTAVVGLALPQVLLIRFQLLAPIYSAEPMAAKIAPLIIPGEPVYAVHWFRRGLPFYLRRTITLVNEVPYDLRSGLRWEPQKAMSMTVFRTRWEAQASGLAIMTPTRWARLQHAGLRLHILVRGPGWVAAKH